jgi:hypothetical protein
MRLLGLILFFFSWFEPILAQTKTVYIDSIAKIATTISVEPKYITTDNLGNIYVVSNTNQLYKYNIEGKLLSTLNYNYVGNITSVDASNPLEVYVFYKELNTIIYLDNNLAFRGKTQLINTEVTLALAAARNYANGIWVFDAADMQLKKLNREGKVLQNSGNIRQFVNLNFNPQFITDDGMQVYVADSASGILVFDVFANYKKTIPIVGSNLTKVSLNKLIAFKQNLLQVYKAKPFVNSITIAINNCNMATLTGNYVIVGTKNNVLVYSVTTEVE